MSFKSNEVGFIVNGNKFTYENHPKQSASQIAQDLISYLILTVPEITEQEVIACGESVWIAKKKSDLSIVSRPSFDKKASVWKVAGGWYVDLHSNNRNKERRIADLADQLNIDIQVKLSIDLSLVEQMVDRLIREHPTGLGQTRVLMVPTGEGKSVTEEFLKVRYPELLISVETITEGIDIPCDLIIANPPYTGDEE